MYNPTIGRWTTEDPISFAGGDTNLFRYAANNSTNVTDSCGLLAERDDYKAYREDKAEPVNYPGPDIGHPGYHKLVGEAINDPAVRERLKQDMNRSRQEKKEVAGYVLYNPTTKRYEVTNSGCWPGDKTSASVHLPKRRANGEPIEGSGYYPVLWYHTHPNGTKPTDEDRAVRERLNSIPSVIIFNPNAVVYSYTRNKLGTLNDD